MIAVAVQRGYPQGKIRACVARLPAKTTLCFPLPSDGMSEEERLIHDTALARGLLIVFRQRHPEGAQPVWWREVNDVLVLRDARARALDVEEAALRHDLPLRILPARIWA